MALPSQLKVRPVIRTAYMGPTDRRGARVLAKHVTNETRVTSVAWDDGLDTLENHLRACRALIDKAEMTEWQVASYAGGSDGYYFTLEPKP